MLRGLHNSAKYGDDIYGSCASLVGNIGVVKNLYVWMEITSR
jgi:hypothetical protein